MFGRLARDESGMTMGLVVIMIVLIGVMGAGLLTFVSTDLNTVIEVNQGQRAFEAADAGVQAARKQLLTDSTINKYVGPDAALNDVQWSPNVANSNCTDLGGSGMCFNDIDGDSATSDSANVTIESRTTPAASYKVISTGGYGDARRRIEAFLQPTSGVKLRSEYYSGQDFICDSNGQISGTTLNLVIEDDATFNSNCEISMTTGSIFVGGSNPDGTVTADFNSNTSLSNGSVYVNGTANFDSNVSVGGGNGLYVRDDAFFNSNTTFANNGRVYVGRDATWNSNAVVGNSSIYVGRNASFDSNSGLNGSSLFSGGNVTLNSSNFSLGTSTDGVYGNWLNSFNPTARGSAQTGIGAVGTISGGGVDKAFRGTRSYDRNTGNGTSTGTRFVARNATPPAASPRRMTFPFDPAEYSQPLADAALSAASSRLTADDINALRAIAQEQEAATGRDHYREVANGARMIRTSGSDQWPTASSSTYGYGTVVFYRFASDSNTNKVMWDINAGCNNTDRKGILVVENGNFEANSTNSGFNGWVLVPNGSFTADSNTCMHAYVYAQDGFTANSNTEIFDVPQTAQQDLNRFRKVNVLSWRECDEAAAGAC